MEERDRHNIATGRDKCSGKKNNKGRQRVVLENTLYDGMAGEDISGRESSKCKGPEVGKRVGPGNSDIG